MKGDPAVLKKVSVSLPFGIGSAEWEADKTERRAAWSLYDEETGKVMCQATGRTSEGWLRVEDIDSFPCEDLRTINQLWLHYSNGKFGFSVQKEIYESLSGTREYNALLSLLEESCSV